ncbi:glycosyltransferase family 2 protein [Microbacterium sp. B35-30]|uniref:glycosyltransferase n=1 Tax=Microbacterium sp. B35-30 TaxID=1962642 RepID=UPI0013D0208A|nr:glycosyltransferase family 2 protein [Microbacterium sp. B35-30]KAF2419640.1 hypothetical protein B2K11_04145 [Microbacterium sp. B35-30]
MTDWTVVTVTYNSSKHLLRHWTGSRAERDFRWVVVDNGSTDDTLQIAMQFADEVIKSGGNVGFSAANNIGLRSVDSKFVAFANPDVAVPGHGWQEDFARAIERSAGVVAPQLRNADGTFQANARGLPFFSSKVRNRLSPNSATGLQYARAGFTHQTYCAWVMGAAVGAKTETIRALGGWDDEYFLYYEDHDLGLRAWRQGIPVSVTPDVQWTHDWQRATTRLSAPAWRAELFSMRKFYGDHPAFRWGTLNSPRALARVRAADYGEMTSLLWRSLDKAERVVT